MALRRPRAVLDRLPEFIRYRDDGCDLHPACLTCPLPRCRYDEPEDGRHVLKQVRNAAVVLVFHREGLSARELAQRFNLSKRTVHRILQAERQGRTEGKGLRAESAPRPPTQFSVLVTQS